MDKSLQKWCDDSLAKLTKSLSTKPGLHNDDVVIEATIDSAAFLALAKSRTIQTDRQWDWSVQRSNEQSDWVEQLVPSCSLGISDPPEILASIHEYLVSRRDRRTTAGGLQSRKSGGIFYTPQHVIDYIVKSTLIPRLIGKSPEQIESLAVLDPAAGSGGFLATAYRALLAWYLDWYRTHEPEKWPYDVVATNHGWRLTFQRCHQILNDHVHGVDVDQNAIHVTQRTLWLILLENAATSGSQESDDVERPQWTTNFKAGHALIGPAFGQADFNGHFSKGVESFHWSNEFPNVASRGGFDLIVGNPPYRRERDFKQELDDIAQTPLVRFRSPRMDLWYYFVHRGIELLRDQGALSYITNAYWIHGVGANKLLSTLRNDVHLDELFLLQNQPVFQDVAGQHSIFSLTRTISDANVTIKLASRFQPQDKNPFETGVTPVRTYKKTLQTFFHNDRINAWPPADELLAKLGHWPRLNEFGIVRQGIAENPATINRRTIERFPEDAIHWKLGEGVFSLSPEEAQNLRLSNHESQLLRPYHDLCDLGRYWSASCPSRTLIYSARHTCPSIDEFPRLRSHLEKFRAILNARRETATGSNDWWHLHWPRDERLWLSRKLIALQMASRPSFVPVETPTYVSFSANVFVPDNETREHLNYLVGLLNSRILWAWFTHHAKHRGVGLELNGHVLQQAPIRKIDFDCKQDVLLHDNIVDLVARRMELQGDFVAAEQPGADHAKEPVEAEICKIEDEIERLVAQLYGLNTEDLDLVDQITERAD